jgi:hypothetical protein
VEACEARLTLSEGFNIALLIGVVLRAIVQREDEWVAKVPRTLMILLRIRNLQYDVVVYDNVLSLSARNGCPASFAARTLRGCLDVKGFRVRGSHVIEVRFSTLAP